MKERSDGPLLVRQDASTAILTLNRLEQRNALNQDLLHLLRDVLAEARDDDAIRSLIITGAGDRAFSAGADVRHMQSMTVERAREWSLLGHDVFQKIEALPKPVIAAINGIAVGGGCELALACDFRFMAKAAQLGQPEIKLGLIPGWGGTQRLPRLIGSTLAKDMVLTGRLMAADEALRVGLANGVAPDPSETFQMALVYARQFASLPPLAIGHAKQAINAGAGASLESAYLIETEQFGHAFATEDRIEGIAAFLEKRAASFKGR